MSLKVFISYRRQDTAATAVGIGQYLEKEFGRKNVYVDVETHAGAKYASVIEKHLAECRVLLVLIGSDWVKLQKPNDWVEREVAYALKREITVIPVLINGAQLPDKELLPDNIQGLLDHQAASVTIAGFRHEMAGLVKDIRSLRTAKPWRLLGAIAAVLLLSVFGGIFVRASGFYNLLEHIRLPASSPEIVTNDVWTNGVWKSRPGEWVMYAIDNTPVAYFLKPSSLKVSGDRVAFTTRYPEHSNVSGASSQSSGEGAYVDITMPMDCNRSVFVMAERAVYNNAGEVILNLKIGEPESLDLSYSQSSSGTVYALAERAVCDETLRNLLLSKPRFNNVHLSYLSKAPDGDGNMFYGPVKPTSNPTYPIEVSLVDKKNRDHGLENVFPRLKVRGLPPSYRTMVENLQINCAARMINKLAIEYYDKDDNLAYLNVIPSTAQPITVTGGSYFDLLNVTCGISALNVAGNYEGTNKSSYGEKRLEQKISLTIQQNESDLKVSYQTPVNAGEGSGTLRGNIGSFSLHSTAPDCPGSFDGSFSFADNSASWSFKGTDCNGAMEGRGTASKVTSSDPNH